MWPNVTTTLFIPTTEMVTDLRLHWCRKFVGLSDWTSKDGYTFNN